jgi:MFS family permease
MNSTLINFIYLLSLVCWIGSIIFFSFFVAPVVFKNLEREKAGELVGIIFPRYYMIGYVCGTLVLGVLLLSGLETAGLKWCAWGIMMLGTACAGLVVNPRAKALKEKLKVTSEPEKSDLESHFMTLHSLSVKLNAAVLFAGLWLLWLSAGNFKI